MQNTHIKKYGDDAMKAMEDIMRCHKEILRVGKSYVSLGLSVFACLRLAKDSMYRTFVEQVNQDVSSNSGTYNVYTPR